MATRNKTCVVCGKKYSYCYDCNTKNPTWMGMFDDENCKQIFDTVNRLYFQHITEAEAIQIFEACNLEVLNGVDANEKIKNTAEQLMAAKRRKSFKKPVVEEMPEAATEENSDTTDEAE